VEAPSLSSALAPPAQLAPRKPAYLPEIDGLRALAVLSVFIFHLNKTWLAGGFTGVDVFFVISGFLISGLIIHDLDEDRFAYRNFYQRRIARIAPAATLVVVVALALGSLLYDRQEFSALGADAVAAMLSVMNVKQLFEGGYFTASPDAQPLIHYWSLAVEEQFYLLFPIMLQLIVRVSGQHRQVVLIALCAVGYAVSILCTPHWPIAAFYLLHTRAWELLAGAVLAAFWQAGQVQAWGYARARMAAGLAVVALGLVFVRSAGFPGWSSILPVAGTTLMLSAAGSANQTVVHRVLVSPLLRFIGQISFSLYLWHWVIFSFANYALFRYPALLVYAVKIVLPFAAAVATWYWFETPARRYLNRRDRRWHAFGAFVLVTALIAGTGFAIRKANYLSAPIGAIARGGLDINAGKSPSVVLIGDSQGAMYGYDLAQIARAHGFAANLLAAAATNELPNEPDTRWPQVASFLHDRHVRVIVLAQAWGSKLGPDGEAHLREALQLLAPHADHIILISQLPIAPDMVSRQAIADGTLHPPVFEAENTRKLRLRTDAILARLAGGQISVMPIADLLTNPDGSLRLIAPNGRLVYHDGDHLSSSGEDMIHARLERVLLQFIEENDQISEFK
jgi:peptidoglycan/LPS O-acetylase OafA/YrhL